MVKGKKTFIFAGLAIVWAVLGMFLANQEGALVQFNTAEGGTLILQALMVVGLRLGITKAEV